MLFLDLTFQYSSLPLLFSPSFSVMHNQMPSLADNTAVTARPVPSCNLPGNMLGNHNPALCFAMWLFGQACRSGQTRLICISVSLQLLQGLNGDANLSAAHCSCRYSNVPLLSSQNVCVRSGLSIQPKIHCNEPRCKLSVPDDALRIHTQQVQSSILGMFPATETLSESSGSFQELWSLGISLNIIGSDRHPATHHPFL